MKVACVASCVSARKVSAMLPGRLVLFFSCFFILFVLLHFLLFLCLFYVLVHFSVSFICLDSPIFPSECLVTRSVLPDQK